MTAVDNSVPVMMTEAGAWQRFLGAFTPGTSQVDWCEPNYAVSSSVAEFYNTASNIPFLVLPVILMLLFRSYAARVSRSIHVIWALMVTIGLGSAYFHGTLSLAGQLLDELSILWLLMAALTLWTPRRLLPRQLAKQPAMFQVLMTLLTVLGTWLGCRYPIVNHVALFFVGAPFATMVIMEAKRSSSVRAKKIGYRSAVFSGLAVVIWVLDKLLCPFWIYLRFPYVHGLWHVAILLGGYEAMVFMAFRTAELDYHTLKPDLRFWPSNKTIIGLPYVSFLTSLPVRTDFNQNKWK